MYVIKTIMDVLTTSDKLTNICWLFSPPQLMSKKRLLTNQRAQKLHYLKSHLLFRFSCAYTKKPSITTQILKYSKNLSKIIELHFFHTYSFGRKPKQYFRRVANVLKNMIGVVLKGEGVHGSAFVINLLT